MQERDHEQIKGMAYTILAEVQVVKEKIYGNHYNELVFFMFLSRLMEEKELISAADMLMKDEFLLTCYPKDDHTVENLVLYMYKWKMHHSRVYI